MDTTTFRTESFPTRLPRFPRYGLVGIAVITAAEVCLFTGVELISIYFTPIVWTGYILLVDALNLHVHGRSLIVSRPREFAAMLPWSILCWLIFEAYNLYLRNWTYVGLPENQFLQVVGYGWSFATIFPGVLETSEFFQPYFVRAKKDRGQFPPAWMLVWMILGAACLSVPMLVSQDVASTMFGLVWIGFFLLLDPMNYLIGGKSAMQQMREGDFSTAIALAIAGLVCGFFWEFWNYWATAKWHYSVPISFVGPKLFEMPLLGYLGFIPFAFEVYAMQQSLVSLFPSLMRRKQA